MKINIESFMTIILLMLYAIIFNIISFSATSGTLKLTNDPLFLFITECTVSTIGLLLYSSVMSFHPLSAFPL